MFKADLQKLPSDVISGVACRGFYVAVPIFCMTCETRLVGQHTDMDTEAGVNQKMTHFIKR